MSATTHASLVSLMNIITRYQHPTCPVSFDQSLLQTLLDKVSSLVDFLEKYDHTQHKSISSPVMKNLETRMTDAAYTAEDLIETYYVNRVFAMEGFLIKCPDHFVLCSDLEKSIKEMDLIIGEVNEATIHHLQENVGALLNSPQRRSNAILNTDSSAASGSSAPPRGKNVKVELDDQFCLLKDRVITHQRSLQIIPVVGMGGIGKTTLVEKVYNDPYVVKRFDIREWATVSQQYDVNDIILSLLHRAGGVGHIDLQALGDQLHERLYGRRYLIVIDDIWSTEAWYNIRRFLPDNNNRSRILLTTRISSVAHGVCSRNSYEMKFLDEDKSWDLLSETIFGQEVFPLELKELGKKIAKRCRGLPLSIVVIGGFLKISEKTQECWVDVLKNMSSIIHQKDYGNFLEILSWSYKQLPIHLKSCFLYMATFKEDSIIVVLDLVRLWVAEGFLKPTRAKTVEDVALEYLKELIDRNLVMVYYQRSKYYWSWKMEFCTIHDSLRDFCRSVAEDEKFFCIMKNDTVNQMIERRFVHQYSMYPDHEPYPCLPSVPNARSFVFNWNINAPEFTSSSRLLRVLHSGGGGGGVKWAIDIAPVNLRHVVLNDVRHNELRMQRWFSSISFAWNLETLVCKYGDVGKISMLLSIIWDLPNLRNLVFENSIDTLETLDREYSSFHTEATLPDPRADQINNVLNNLQTLYGIQNFNCTDELVNMIPNMRELGIHYSSSRTAAREGRVYYEDPLLEDNWEVSRCFSNVASLHKLEKLYICCGYSREGLTKEPESLRFSPNLRHLILDGCRIPWEYMTIAGSLPNLEILRLYSRAAVGEEWNSVDGNFQRLKHLVIYDCDLRTWRAEGSHFPRLESLSLATPLEEIPCGMWEVSSLEYIRLRTRIISPIISARQLLDQRDEDDDLIVDVCYNGPSEEDRVKAKELANDKLRVEIQLPGDVKEKKGQPSNLRNNINDRLVRAGMDDNINQFRFTPIRSISIDSIDIRGACCNLSPDGKLVAIGHSSGMVSLWCPFTLENKKVLATKHSMFIKDVRFSHITGFLATLSADKTVEIWDLHSPDKSLRTLVHSNELVSIDFCPNKDLICCGYRDGQIIYWSINTGRCKRSVSVIGRLRHLRFQPSVGRYLAVACDNLVSVLDAESLTFIYSLNGHDAPVKYVCWNTSGDLLASLSSDSVRVWTLSSGREGECLNELYLTKGPRSLYLNHFHSAVFHPKYSYVLVVGTEQRMLVLWNIKLDTTIQIPAHKGKVTSLAASTVNGLIASAGRFDVTVDLWELDL